MKATPGVMRIGEVHAELRKIFPTVELSKIRYYEDKGLVQPSRSRKGYRLYSERDVECLREAIRLAQEEFVPLRVVRLRLIEQGLLDPPTANTNGRHVARDAERRRDQRTGADTDVHASTSADCGGVAPLTSMSPLSSTTIKVHG